MRFAKTFTALLGASALVPCAVSALSIEPSTDAFGLANTLFLNVGGLAIQSASLSGEVGQSGVYNNASGTYGLPPRGIVFSTGNVSDYAAGPNTQPDTTTGYAYAEVENEVESLAATASAVPTASVVAVAPPGIATKGQNALLSPISGQGEHFDPVQLDISFYANDITDQVTFFTAFGSEEFPEYQGEGANDAFGLFVNGVNVANVAGAPINIDNPDFAEIEGTELDGLLAPGGNPILQFDVPVNAGAINDFTIILADTGNEQVDTTIYLSSFFAEPDDVGGNNAGETQFNPVLPTGEPDPETGAFLIEMPEVQENEIIWVDPPVTTGYEYAIDSGPAGIAFDSVTAPSLATVGDLDGYTLTVGGSSVALPAGGFVDLMTTFGVMPTSFTITGIDPALMLDPSNPIAFPVGVSLNAFSDDVMLTVTPMTIDIDGEVPLPASALLYLGALAIGAGAARRRTA